MAQEGHLCNKLVTPLLRMMMASATVFAQARQNLQIVATRSCLKTVSSAPCLEPRTSSQVDVPADRIFCTMEAGTSRKHHSA